MEKITETLSGELSIDKPGERKSFLINRINEVIKPPRLATENNVNIRAMYLLNDLVNSHGGRFERDELSALCELILDTPVMIGHNRAEAPMARTFHAELEEKGDVIWLKSYFYWPSREEGAADEILDKIDSGILKECSISFVYTFPQCSVCSEDMRKCPHDISLSSDENARQYFFYRGIKEVLETSLVYKGSVKGTFVTDRLARPNLIHATVHLDNHKKLITIPKPHCGRALLYNLHNDCNALPAITFNDPDIVSTIVRKKGRLYLAASAK
ncbi:MAG: hypothetical protein JSW64_12140 [Candidatus Zixiibacteriota bacterium]|nr:MAG: hypothetical protein JSW64_12140 [candidate division Zixibacteria bacterium]